MLIYRQKALNVAGIFVLVALLSWLWYASFMEQPSTGYDWEKFVKQGNTPDELHFCETDSDCVETQQSCCSCNSGGKQIAIKKDYLPAWKNLIKESCNDISCPEIYLCKKGTIKCVNKKCEFVIINDKDCIKEGEYVDTFDRNSFTCCEGLIKVDARPLDENCKVIIPNRSFGIEPGWRCINCGDKICNPEYENKCNCPEDCS